MLLLGLDEVTSAVSRLGEDCVFVLSCVQLFAAPCTIALWALLSMELFRQESCSGQFPTPGDLLDPEVESLSLTSPELGGVFLTNEPPGKAWGKTSNLKWV